MAECCPDNLRCCFGCDRACHRVLHGEPLRRTWPNGWPRFVVKLHRAMEAQERSPASRGGSE